MFAAPVNGETLVARGRRYENRAVRRGATSRAKLPNQAAWCFLRVISAKSHAVRARM